MSDYKLVPVDTVRRAANILGSQGFDVWDQLASELDGILTAPDVQGEPVAMSKDKMRDEFDSWIEQQGMITMKDGETYYHHATHAAWQAWKASRAAIAAYRKGARNEDD